MTLYYNTTVNQSVALFIKYTSRAAIIIPCGTIPYQLSFNDLTLCTKNVIPKVKEICSRLSKHVLGHIILYLLIFDSSMLCTKNAIPKVKAVCSRLLKQVPGAWQVQHGGQDAEIEDFSGYIWRLPRCIEMIWAPNSLFSRRHCTLSKQLCDVEGVCSSQAILIDNFIVRPKFLFHRPSATVYNFFFAILKSWSHWRATAQQIETWV